MFKLYLSRVLLAFRITWSAAHPALASSCLSPECPASGGLRMTSFSPKSSRSCCGSLGCAKPAISSAPWDAGRQSGCSCFWGST